MVKNQTTNHPPFLNDYDKKSEWSQLKNQKNKQILRTGLISKYQVDSVYIDGANPSFIKSLKIQIGEEADYDKVIARYKAEGFGDDPTKDMIIAPVNFNKDHKANSHKVYHT